MEIIYRANDGMEFDTKDECIYHEEAAPCLKLFYKFFDKKGINYTYYEDGFLIENGDKYQRCEDIEELFKAFYPYLKNFADGNADEDCATALGLLKFCLDEGDFGDICSIYIRDDNNNWILYDNWEAGD